MQLDGSATTNADNGTSDTLSATQLLGISTNGNGTGSGASSANSDGTGSGYDPDAPYGRKADGTPKRKRGRKPGVDYGQPASRPATQKAGIPAVDAIAGTLYSIHATLSVFTQIPEITLSEDEAKRLAQATAIAAQASNVEVDPRVAAYINLATVAASIYGPRALHFYARMKHEKSNSANA